MDIKTIAEVKPSKRLQAVAGLVTEGNRLADVGTDHGYVPIFLLQQHRIPKAIAMDIKKGPLERAEEHIRAFHLEAYIETRQSDGVANLTPGEVDTILIAGMGGGLVIHIVSEGQQICKAAKELILQPQSEISRVREYLWENHYKITTEDMVFEDGKYYPMMRVIPEREEETFQASKPTRLELYYGSVLLQERHPVLDQYLRQEQELYKSILEELKKQEQTPGIQKRSEEIWSVLQRNQQARSFFVTEGNV